MRLGIAFFRLVVATQIESFVALQEIQHRSKPWLGGLGSWILAMFFDFVIYSLLCNKNYIYICVSNIVYDTLICIYIWVCELVKGMFFF
jgi:hypothetical protein